MGTYSQKLFITFKKHARNFYLRCAHYQQENLMQGVRLVNKGWAEIMPSPYYPFMSLTPLEKKKKKKRLIAG